jgi:hypothetical protein
MRSIILITFLILTALPLPALARRCDDVISCNINGVETGTNLKALRERRASPGWVRKHCGCDWNNPAPSSGRSGTVVMSDAMPEPEPGQAIVPIARDAKGRLGPTPAPRDAQLTLPDDGPFAADLATAAARYKLPVLLLRAVMQVESGGNPLVVSHKGAVGLMQLLPATAQALGVDDIHDTAQNIMGGARFLRILANRFDGDLVKTLSGYHAGSMRVQGRDATPFAATDDYVRKILRIYYQLRDVAGKPG